MINYLRLVLEGQNGTLLSEDGITFKSLMSRIKSPQNRDDHDGWDKIGGRED